MVGFGTAFLYLFLTGMLETLPVVSPPSKTSISLVQCLFGKNIFTFVMVVILGKKMMMSDQVPSSELVSQPEKSVASKSLSDFPTDDEWLLTKFYAGNRSDSELHEKSLYSNKGSLSSQSTWLNGMP